MWLFKKKKKETPLTLLYPRESLLVRRIPTRPQGLQADNEMHQHRFCLTSSGSGSFPFMHMFRLIHRAESCFSQWTRGPTRSRRGGGEEQADHISSCWLTGFGSLPRVRVNNSNSNSNNDSDTKKMMIMMMTMIVMMMMPQEIWLLHYYYKQ